MSLNQRLIRTNDTGGAGGNLVIGFNDGYVYGAGGLVKVDAGISYGLNVMYHPVSGKYYACQGNDDANPVNYMYESSDGGATWSIINFPAGSIAGVGSTSIYNPQTQKIYFARTRASVMYVYSVNSDGTIGYNTVNNPHPASGFAVNGTDYSYVWLISSTGQSNGGSYFVPIAGFDGSGSSVSINTSMRLISGTNTASGQGLNWSTGHLKSYSLNDIQNYYSTSGSFENNVYADVQGTAYTMTYENDAWFVGSNAEKNKLYRGTTVNSSMSLVFTHTQNLSAVRYSPTDGKYYCFDALGDVYSSSNGISWSFDFFTGGTIYAQTVAAIANFV